MRVVFVFALVASLCGGPTAHAAIGDHWLLLPSFGGSLSNPNDPSTTEGNNELNSLVNPEFREDDPEDKEELDDDDYGTIG